MSMLKELQELKKQVVTKEYYYVEEIKNKIVGDYSEGLASVVLKDPIGEYGRLGFMDMEGKLVIPCIFDNKKSTFKEGLAPVKLCNEYGYGRYGYIDKKGMFKISRKYDDARSFSEGRAAVKINASWGFIDKEGKTCVPFFYEKVKDFKQGLAAAKRDGKWGYIEKNGNVIVPFEYEDAKNSSLSEEDIILDSVLPVKKNGKWGYINESNKVAIPFQYDDVGSFDDLFSGLAPVKKDNKYGFIDSNGKLVIDYIYDDAKEFKEGLAAVKKGEKWGFIDHFNNIKVNFIYDNVNDFNDGISSVTNYEIITIDHIGNNVTNRYVTKNGSVVARMLTEKEVVDNKPCNIIKNQKVYLLNYNDEVETFTSESELNSFINKAAKTKAKVLEKKQN